MIIYGDARSEFLLSETLPDIFEATAQRHPDRVALIEGERAITYRELDAAADRIAHRLIRAGVGKPQAIIALWLERGTALLTAQLGITKSGAAWLPFDADTPAPRVARCLRDAGAVALVCDSEHRGRFADSPECPLLVVDELLLPLPPSELMERRNGLTQAHPAYAIYTSGSTGKPKGILIGHASICHLLRSENSRLQVTSEDRVYQGFSVSFDMSFEEIWISFLVGATLWIAPREITTDPEALFSALVAGQITVLHAVPSLAALLPARPPTLRIVNLGGEVCPQSLSDLWAANGKALFNTYGPTETTVTATLARMEPGVPVTIGLPLPNYGLAIVDANLCPVEPGTAGELCIFGPGLALGYVGLPELTREKYPEGPFEHLPGVQRLYRTGDQVRTSEGGALQFLGRIDEQVKIRGFRIELGEIEAALARCAGVRSAAVVVRNESGEDMLVAFLVTEAGLADATKLRGELASELPAYMIPSQFVPVADLPRLASGKLDRGNLGTRALPPSAATEMGDKPSTRSEEAVFAALSQIFPGRALRHQDDFFSDLGGHSLTAARFVSRLRTDHGYTRAGVRDVYTHRRLGAIAAAIEANQAHPANAVKPRIMGGRVAAHRRWLCGLFQLLVLPIPVCTHMVIWLAPFFTYHYLTGDEGDSILFAAGMAVVVFLAAQAAAFPVAILAKWIVLGRLRPGRYPLWGITYFRVWFVRSMLGAVSDYLLNGTPLYPVYLRLLGARVGRDVYIGSIDVEAVDLLELRDGASVGTSVHIANARVENGVLVVGRAVVGDEALLDSCSVVENDTLVGAGSTLGPLSSLPALASIPNGQVWEGIPARFSAAAQVRPSRAPSPTTLRVLAEWLFYVTLGGVVSAIFFLPILPAMMLVDYFDAAWLDTYEADLPLLVAFGVYTVLGLPAAAIMVSITLGIAAGLRRLVGPKIVPGSWPIHGGLYYRKWISSQIQDNSLNVLQGLFATIYSPHWFRALGARVGKNTEISTAMGITPELLVLGDDCFVADGAVLGDEQVRDGYLTLVGTRIGARSFVGNAACIPDGTTLPPDTLIGVQSTVPQNSSMKVGQTWLGNPPICLPAREIVAGFPESLTFHPSWLRRVARGLVELIRIVVPITFAIAFGYLAVRLIMPTLENEQWGSGLLLLASAGLIFGASAVALVLATKWLLIGRYRPRGAPMWTWFVWRSEAVTALYESLAVPNLLIFLEGTPLLPLVLRLFGVRIGSGVFLNTTDVTEFDCVEIGDGAELNADSGPQTHLFEDRVMKIGRVKIGAGAVVGVRSIVLYDAVVGDGVCVGALSLVGKGERLPPDTEWVGSPAAPKVGV